MTKTKTFDCVEMKRQGQQRLRQRLEGMNTEQQIEWWRQRNEEFMRKQERLHAQRRSSTDRGDSRPDLM